MQQNEVYQKITDTVLQFLEHPTNNIHWQKQWRTFAGSNHCSILGRPYKGINQILCGIEAQNNNFTSKRWATFQQWNKMGHKIKKGSKGTVIIMYKKIIQRSDIPVVNKGKITEEKIYNLLKTYVVFNGSQIDGYTEPNYAEPKMKWDENDFLMIDNRAKELGAVIKHFENESPYYSPMGDYINMPHKFQFDKPEHYYATFLHELTHWTNKENRSPRSEKIAKLLKNEDGFHNPDNYAFEELVAELGSAFLLSHYNLSSDEQMRIDHIPYIQSWIKHLKKDNKAIIKASAFAQKACDFITGNVYVVDAENTEKGELANV